MQSFESFIMVLLGLCFGSFVSMASWRLPLGKEMVVSPSSCTACGTRLALRDLFPLLSWVWNRGKCRACGAGVSWRYPVIEMATAAMFYWIYSRFGLTAHTAFLLAMGVVLLVMIVVDFEHYLIPDEIHIALLLLAIAHALREAVALEEVAMGLASGLMVGLGLRYGYVLLRRKEGLGLGDVKFLAVAGAWLGPEALLPFLFMSGVLGVATGLVWRALGKGRIFPFGPALALALYLCIVYPELIDIFWEIWI